MFKICLAMAATCGSAAALAQSDPEVLICPPGGANPQGALIQNLPPSFHYDPSGSPVTLVKDEANGEAGTRIVITTLRTGRFTYHAIVQGWKFRGQSQERMSPDDVRQIATGIGEMFPCPTVP